jgi:hypothetical protein
MHALEAWLALLLSTPCTPPRKAANLTTWPIHLLAPAENQRERRLRQLHLVNAAGTEEKPEQVPETTDNYHGASLFLALYTTYPAHRHLGIFYVVKYF